MPSSVTDRHLWCFGAHRQDLLPHPLIICKLADLISQRLGPPPHQGELQPFSGACSTRQSQDIPFPFQTGELWMHTAVLLCPELCWQRSEMQWQLRRKRGAAHSQSLQIPTLQQRNSIASTAPTPREGEKSNGRLKAK